MKKCRYMLILVLAFVLLFSAMIIQSSAATDLTIDDINTANMFFLQEGDRTCTLSAAAMLVRRSARLNGNTNWSSVTESSMRSTAWSADGLWLNFTYAGISVRAATISGTRDKLIDLLRSHPEGFVVWNGNQPHAVLLTDYTDGHFYCADPLREGRIRLSDSTLKGSGEDAKIAGINQIWYVASPSLTVRGGAVRESDTQKPTITGAYLTNITPTGYDVVISAEDNYSLSKIMVGTWNDSIGIGEAKWKTENVGGGSSATATVHIDIADFGGVQDTYHSNVYAYDASGNVSEVFRAGDVELVIKAPKISSAYITNVTPMGYDVVVSAENNFGIAEITVGTWNDSIGIGAAKWKSELVNGVSSATVTFHIDIADFDGAWGMYHSNVFAYDMFGNANEDVRAGDVELGPPTISSAYITNITPMGYDVVVNAKSNFGIAEITVGTWNDGIGIGAAKWKSELVGGVSSATVTFHIDIADFDGARGMYHSNVFAYDMFGNANEDVRAGDVELGPPTISSAYITNITPMGYDVVVNAKSNFGIAEITVGTWNDGIGIGAAKWKGELVGDVSSATATFHIDIADFDGAQGTYHSNVYAYDVYGNANEEVRAGDVELESVAPVVSNAYLTNGTVSGYDVVMSARDNVGVAWVRIGTWNDVEGIEAAHWQDFSFDTSAAEQVVHLDISEFGSIPGWYHTNVLAIDTCGNISESVRAGDFLLGNVPTILEQGTDANCSGVTVRWSAIRGAERYRVFYRAGSGNWIAAGDTTATDYTVTGLTSGTTYTFTVRCVDASGSYYSSAYDAVGQTVTYLPVHTEVKDNSIEATCTSTGLTEGSHCSVCGEILVEQKITERLPHCTELKNARSATRRSVGYTGDEICVVCDSLLCAGEEIPVRSGLHTLVLPKNLRFIEAEAFRGSAAQCVILPANCKQIGTFAFADCKSLELIEIPESVTLIADNAFAEDEQIVLVVENGSYAEKWAIKNNIAFVCEEFVDEIA